MANEEAFEEVAEQPKRGRGRPRNDEKSSSPEKDKAPNRPAKSNSPKPWPQAVSVEKSLKNYLTTIGAGLAFVNKADGDAIIFGADDLAHELVELAKVDRTYRQYLEWLTKPGKYGGVIMASGAIIVPILANHGLMPNFKIPFGADQKEDTKDETK